MWKKRVVLLIWVWVIVVLILSENVSSSSAEWKEQSLEGLVGALVKKYERSTIVSTEYGDVSEAVVTDGNGPFQLHFITLDPNSLFLPVLLHYDMVFYVQTGSGKLNYLDEDEKEQTELKQGDIHRLRSGAVFFIQSDLENQRQKLRVIAIFDNPDYDLNDPSSSGPYSRVSDLVLGFDETVLRAVFKAPEPLIEEIRNGTRPGAIIHGLQKKKKNTEYEYEFMEEMYNILDLSSNKHKKSKLFNLNDKDPDFKNEHGWSTIVDSKKYAPLKGSKYGVFMVYLTEGSMMGPHWNPMAAEVVVPVKGKGMIHVVCPRMMNVSKCSNSRFYVEEGDLLVVPRFHAMAQMAFKNETFVFVGFSTSTRRNHPQYLAGKASVQRTLDKHIMAASLGINVPTYEKLTDKQDKSIILDCTSCAEEEWMRLMEEIEEERRKEERKAEEEARKREEERRKEEEEARKREEEEARKREEEEARKREEEEAQRKREEEEEAQRKREEEEAAQKKREEEGRKRKEEEERERQEEQQKQEEEREEEERKQREQQQQQEEEEKRERQEQKQREQEEWAAREREREQEQAQEAEREAQAEREEEAARKKEEKEAAEGQKPWGEGQEESEEEWHEQQQPEEREREEQEEWTDKERKHEQGQEQWREDQGERGGNQKRTRRILNNIA